LRLDEIVSLLQAGITEETITVYARARGLARDPTAEEERLLRTSGASEALLARLRELTPPAPAPPWPTPSALEAGEPDRGPPVPAPYRFGVTTQAVRVPISVTDEKGRPVTDLQQEDFRLFDEGELQPIAFFSSERKQLRIGILLDVSGSMHEKMDAVADSLKHFVELLEAEDEVFVLTFSQDAELIRGLTSDRRGLASVLEGLEPSGATALNDAVVKGLFYLDSIPAESKALVLVTDGVDTASESSFDEALAAARRAEAPVYSIGLGHTGGTGSRTPHGASGSLDFRPRPLRKLAEETGGMAEILLDFDHHHEGSVDRLKQAAQAIALSLRHRYLLGYQSSPQDARRGWRRIRIEVDRRSVNVRARKGYYSRDLGTDERETSRP